LYPVVRIVDKKSSSVPIAEAINVSVSLLCSPVKFSNSPSSFSLKNSNSLLTV
jgi:hypothetical protein